LIDEPSRKAGFHCFVDSAYHRFSRSAYEKPSISARRIYILPIARACGEYLRWRFPDWELSIRHDEISL
jgi:hypothetical protein